MTAKKQFGYIELNYRIRELEQEVETWKAAYRKAIRRDDVIIQRLTERQCAHAE